MSNSDSSSGSSTAPLQRPKPDQWDQTAEFIRNWEPRRKRYHALGHLAWPHPEHKIDRPSKGPCMWKPYYCPIRLGHTGDMDRAKSVNMLMMLMLKPLGPTPRALKALWWPRLGGFWGRIAFFLDKLSISEGWVHLELASLQVENMLRWTNMANMAMPDALEHLTLSNQSWCLGIRKVTVNMANYMVPTLPCEARIKDRSAWKGLHNDWTPTIRISVTGDWKLCFRNDGLLFLGNALVLFTRWGEPTANKKRPSGHFAGRAWTIFSKVMAIVLS